VLQVTPSHLSTGVSRYFLIGCAMLFQKHNPLTLETLIKADKYSLRTSHIIKITKHQKQTFPQGLFLFPLKLLFASVQNSKETLFCNAPSRHGHDSIAFAEVKTKYTLPKALLSTLKSKLKSQEKMCISFFDK
jgi:hypothetical protein